MKVVLCGLVVTLFMAGVGSYMVKHRRNVRLLEEQYYNAKGFKVL
ncbi:hypothetical protein [Bacillus thuringiensis]|nr:hypothetical protein [Bacillus thuringiensis]MED3275410.1 hypothetical protein [Bacillus thuringiensis]